MNERPRLLPHLIRVVRDPRRLARLLVPEARQSATKLLYRSLGYYAVRPRGRVWRETGLAGLKQREFRSYDAYVRVQRSKLKLLNLSDYDDAFRRALSARLTRLRLELRGASVLCLAARSGAEVRSFHDQGAFAVGLDLNPGRENALVLPGDFHNLQFPDSCVSLVYCNSFDHALDIRRVCAEVRRVLIEGGHLLLEVMQGTNEGNGEFGRWEASSWDSVEALLDVVFDVGFERAAAAVQFEVPWSGEAYLLRATPE